jgi:U3 small nucleolar RNA-associated protein 7
MGCSDGAFDDHVIGGCRYLEAEGMERTYKFKQAAIKQHIDIQTERKMFDLDLDAFGPYRVSYDRAGRYCPCLARACHVVAD